MITQRAVLLGFVGFCFYLIALVNNLPGFYYALTWLTVGILGSCLGIALLSLVAMSCHWEVARARASEPGGTDEETFTGPVVRVHLANGGTLNKTGVVLEIRLARVQAAPSEAGGREEILVRRFLLEAIPSGQSVDASITIPELPRGRYQIRELRLIGSDVLGLFRARKRLPVADSDSQEIIVGPAIVAAGGANWHETTPGRIAGAVEARFRVGQGEDLRGTRGYVPGDDLRHVHWATTARVGELVVKEYHHRGRGSSLVIWDGTAGVDWGNGEAGEWGLRLAASLCYTLALGGAPCVVARLDGTPLLIEGRNGEDFHTTVIEALADARTDRKGSLAAAAGIVKGEFEDVIIITASLSHDVLQTVAHFARPSQRCGVSVALIDGASLGKATRDKRFVSRVSLKSPPNQIEEVIGEDGVARKVQHPVTSKEYEARVRELRNAGACVILVRAENGDTPSFVGPITSALRTLLIGGASHSSYLADSADYERESPVVAQG